MVQHGFQWFCGTVTIAVFGEEIQRFFNICRANELFLRDIQTENGQTVFSMNAAEVKKLKPILKKTHTKIRILKKTGLPFLRLKLRKKRSFTVGVILAGLMLYSLTFFIWNITVEGNYSYTAGEITDFLNSMQVTGGILKANVDCDAIEKAIRNQYNDITWVCAELNGTRLIIHIKENYDTQIPKEEADPYHLTAKRDAVVTSILTRSGTPLVKQGDTVKAGDILVSGIVSVYDDNGEPMDHLLVNADADIYGETTYTYHKEIPLAYREKEYTGNQIVNYYCMIDQGRLLLQTQKTEFADYDRMTDDHWVSILKNFYLPVHYGTETILEYRWVDKTYTEAEANQVAEADFNLFLEKFIKKGIQIIEKNDTIQIIGENCVVDGTVTVVEPIGKVRPVEQSELPEINTEGTEKTE